MQNDNKSDSDVMAANNNFIFNFPDFTEFDTLWKPESLEVWYDSYMYFKYRRQNMKILNMAPVTLFFKVRHSFWGEVVIIAETNADSKSLGTWI